MTYFVAILIFVGANGPWLQVSDARFGSHDECMAFLAMIAESAPALDAEHSYCLRHAP